MNKVFTNKTQFIEDIMEHECPDQAEDVRQKLGDPLVLSDENLSTKCKFAFSTKGYIVSDLCFLDQQVIAAYAIMEHSSDNPAGQVIVWNMDSPKEPMWVGKSRDKVNRIYVPPNQEDTEALIIWGGLSNGQVVKWDMKSEKKDPVLMTKPNLAVQSQPIYGIIGHDIGQDAFGNNMNSKRILTFSNDGKCCIWRENDLTMPDATVHIKFTKPQDGNRTSEKDQTDLPLAPLIVKLVDDHVLIGTFDRLWHKFPIKEFFKGNESLAVSEDSYHQGHQGPICAISHLTLKDFEFPTNGYILTASFDFEICLWDKEGKLVHRLEFHEDFVTGVDWCTLHPGMFVSSDSCGNLALWNLLEDKDYPIYTTKTDPISYLHWQKDSLQIAAGTCTGNIEIYPLKKSNLKYSEEQLEELYETVNEGFE